MLVVDASVLVPALADDGVDGDTARTLLRGASLAAPDLIDLEVLSVLRRLTQGGHLDARRAELALTDLGSMPLARIAHARLLRRCWELRANLTAYDASYVALAEMLEVVLLTADERLARAPGVRCAVQLP